LLLARLASPTFYTGGVSWKTQSSAAASSSAAPALPVYLDRHGRQYVEDDDGNAAVRPVG